ncbi:MAG: YopX family protein [Muribaculaceae bacterium]|nr:YopX family protein [Muribaculaceae bacterium]
MRQIKFRGKQLNGEWAYGDLLRIGGGCIIYIGSKTETATPDIPKESEVAVELFDNDIAIVIPDTIGQFTGLTDRNGKEIYEGDIIRSPLNHEVVVKYGYKEHRVSHHGVVDSFAAYGWIVENLKNGLTDFLDNDFLQGEVIENVFDNPELITNQPIEV